MTDEEKLKYLQYQVSVLETVLLRVICHIDSEQLRDEINYVLDFLKDNSEFASHLAIENFQERLKINFE